MSPALPSAFSDFDFGGVEWGAIQKYPYQGGHAKEKIPYPKQICFLFGVRVGKGSYF